MTKLHRFLTLAALLVLPLAACDEGDDTVAPPGTGSVTGAVTIDGTGQAGVTVSLSNGKTATTNSSGQYTISDVAIGSYTVSISGQPADAVFPSSTQAAVVATAGQVVTVNFAGSRVRTSSIIGAVTGAGGVALNNVTVTLSGTESRTTTSSAQGQYSFTGLRAGAYTVAITAPAGQTCPTTSAAVTVAAGEAKVQNFSCAAAGAATIRAFMFLDENPKDDAFNGATAEDTLKVANVTVTLEGPTLGDTRTASTSASGVATFTNLVPGTYNVRVDAASPALVGSGATYGGPANITVTVAAGATQTAALPFDVTSQQIKVYAFLGRDVSPAPAGISTSIPRGVAPIQGVIIDLYPTETDLNAGTNKLGTDTTDVNGETQFNFLRSADTSPQGSSSDQIVFADFISGPNLHTLNGEDQIEIRYNSRNQVGLAPDTFDMLNSRVNLRFDALGISGQPLAGWVGAAWLNDTTATAVARKSAASDATGKIVMIDTVGPASLPDTFFMRLSGTQAAAGGVTFDQTPVAQRGSVVNKYLRWIHNGTTATSDTVDVGDERVTLTQVSVYLRVYHERDDSVAGGPPRMSSGDNIENTDNTAVTLRWRQTGATVDSVRTLQTQFDGVLTFLNVPTGQTNYRLAARPFPGPNNQVILNDTSIALGTGAANLGDFSGGTPNTMVCPLGVNTLAGCATFAFKYNNGQINGRVKASDSTGAAGLIVTLSATAQTIQGSPNMIDTTDANGLFGFVGIREGKYNLTLTPNTTWGIAGGQANPVVDTVQNNGDIDIKNFIVRRLDTSIRGVVVNDRDIDNVIDPAEALAAVTIQLYRNNSNTSTTAITLDTLVATTTTDANGGYQFNNLPEARYIVKAVQPTTAIVTRRVDGSTGGHVDTTVVRTAAAATPPVGFEDMARTVGSTTPAVLPYWNYPNSSVANNGRTHFTFLYNNNTATGVITNASAAPVSGMTVTLRRCLTSNPAQTVKPPFGPANCLTYYPNAAPVTTTTNTTGTFTYSNLQEGVYEITPSPATAGLTVVNPASRLFLQQGNADIEKGDFSAS